jgi:NAD(P)-dependent dehydrogenase (short-subunit alcohol dehydrogenase family)
VEIEDKVAVVTGAGSGIGRAVARRLALEGAAVVVADVDEDAGASAVREIQSERRRSAFILIDVTSKADVERMVAFAEGEFGGLDVLVNNAGGVTEPYFPECEPEQWGRAIDLNLRGVMLGIHFGVRAMRKRGGGAIVNISSLGGIGFQPYDAPEYGAAKARYPRGADGHPRQLHLPGLGGHPRFPTQPRRDDTRRARKVGPSCSASTRGDCRSRRDVCRG